ncbi:MAG: tetratricopeptide repeat protein [Bacteroidia bacterium]|nr:tetratricopeptide repeat protein [Bacteroidia bacterium]
MKKIRFAVLMSMLLLTYTEVAAQGYSRKKTDSLLAILPMLQKDTTRVKALYEIAYDYQYINPVAGVQYGKEAISLATSLQFKKGIATACAMTGLNYAALTDFKNALLYETRAITYYRQAGNKGGEAAMLSNISLIYSEQSNYPRALENAYAALKIYEALSLKTNQAYLLDNIGTIFFRNKNYSKALSCYDKSEAIYTAEKDRAGLARAKANKGMVSQKMNELD